MLVKLCYDFMKGFCWPPCHKNKTIKWCNGERPKTLLKAFLRCFKLYNFSYYLPKMSIKSGEFCVAYKCFSGLIPKEKEVALFSFPSDPVLRDVWTKGFCRTGFEPNEKSMLCADHFEDNCFKDKLRLELKADAVPTLLSRVNEDIPVAVKKTETRLKKKQEDFEYCSDAFENENCSEASQKNGEKTNRPSVASFCRVRAISKPHLSYYGDYKREFRLARKTNKYLPIVWDKQMTDRHAVAASMDRLLEEAGAPLANAGKNSKNRDAKAPTVIKRRASKKKDLNFAVVSVDCSEPIKQDGDVTVDKLCRVCAKSKPYVLSIFGDFGKKIRLAKKLNKYMPIVVSESDRLPLIMCRECVKALVAYVEMHRHCLGAEKKLLSMLEKDTDSDKQVSTEVVKEDKRNDNDNLSAEDDRIDVDATEELEWEQNRNEEGNIGSLHGNKGSVAVGTTEVPQAKHSCSEVSNKRVEPKQETNEEYDVFLLVECTYCKCMFLKKDLLEHAEFCEQREEFAIGTNIEQLAKLPRKSNGLGINTKRLIEVFEIKPGPRIKREKIKSIVKKNTPIVRKKDKKNKTQKIRKSEVLGQYSVVGDKYVCGLCSSELPCRSAFVFHRKECCPFAHFTCSYCGIGYRANNLLTAHIRRTHVDQCEEFLCDICGTTFFNKRNFTNHVKYHFQERDFKCDKCFLDFKRMDHLRLHKKNKHGMPMGLDKGTKFVCAICSGQFRNESILRIHELKHAGDKSYVCEKCGKRFFSQMGLRCHQSRANCTETKKKKKQIRKYNKAAYERRKNEPPKFHCEQCPRSFRLNGLLQWHIRCFHLKEKPFTCKICDMKFHYISTLARHKAKEHTGLKHACNICLRRFMFPSDVKNHMVVHGTDKPHGCPVCGKLFKYLADMTRHIKKDHLKGKSTGAKENERKMWT